MVTVQSGGELSTLERAWSPGTVNYGRSVSLFDNVYADYETIYKTQPAVRTIISFLARNIAQLGIHVFLRISDTDRERLTEHGLARTLKKPNPFTTRYRLLDGIVNDLGIYDDAYLVKFRHPTTDEVNVIRVPPRHIEPVGDSWMQPDGFLVKGNKGRVIVPTDGIVHFHGYNPDDPRCGLSPMETIRQTLAEEYAAASYRESMWRNGARMEHVITRPADAPVLSPEAKDRFWARWNAQYAGTSNSGKTALLEEGMDIKPMSFSAKDAQYLEARKFNLEEVARFYHVPLPMVGILDHATYSNISEQHKQLYMDTLGPWLEMLQEDIELQLLPDYPDSLGVYVEFNLAEKLKGSFEEQAASLSRLTGGPVMSRNEGRARLNLPRIDDPAADQLITPLNVLIGGQASPADSAPKTRPALLLDSEGSDQ